MHPKNLPPLFVPAEYWLELERLPKAALMDLAWELAAYGLERDEDTIAHLREFTAAILNRRDQR